MLFGEGFGRPLIDFYIKGGVAVRQPHNTHLTVLVRLGLLGFILWLVFHWIIIRRFWKALHRWQMGSFEHTLLLWFLVFYTLGMLVTTVQPWLEFSYGSIPFFILLGFAIGRMQKDENSYDTQLLPAGRR